MTQTTDQGGTVHQFDYDLLGRQTQDRVTALGTDVDDAVLRIETTYEVRGMKEHLTSYDDAMVGLGAVVNDCQFVYNDFGQLITEYQSHDGAVDTDTTPKVQYAYADGAANTIRQTQLIYPNGRELTYDYGAADSTDDAASRVASLIDDDGTTHLVDYSYLGQGTFVVTDYTEPETQYTLVGTAGGDDPDTGDIYRGLDRYGRIKDSYWYNYGDSSDTDRIKYGYDRVGNRLWRENVVATAASKAFDELYQYDQIHRLKHMDRGTLNGPHTGMTTTTFAQCWTLDETGNWGGFREDDTGDGTWDLIQAREANPVNEISAISESAGPTWVSPTYSPAGNMKLMPKPADPTESFTATYDAWNRMVKMVDTASTDTISEYVYDGAKRRIVQASYDEGVLDETRHFYYTQPSQWQDIEERLGTTPDTTAAAQQFVWGKRYIDDCVLRERDTDNDEEFDERLYSIQDANWNVTALLSGTVTQRMAYSVYGMPLCLSSTWDSQLNVLAWEILYGGYNCDLQVWCYNIRHRTFTPSLGVWIQRDPAGYTDGMSAYNYFNPLNATDPVGLAIILHGCCNFVQHCGGCPCLSDVRCKTIKQTFGVSVSVGRTQNSKISEQIKALDFKCFQNKPRKDSGKDCDAWVGSHADPIKGFVITTTLGKCNGGLPFDVPPLDYEKCMKAFQEWGNLDDFRFGGSEGEKSQLACVAMCQACFASDRISLGICADGICGGTLGGGIDK